MLRNIVSVITGYAIFVVTSLAFFKFTGQNPHVAPTTMFLILTILYGAFFSFIAGLVAQLIASKKNINVNIFLALIIAGFATFSFFKSEGEHWTQIIAIFIFAPISFITGLFYCLRNKQTQ